MKLSASCSSSSLSELSGGLSRRSYPMLSFPSATSKTDVGIAHSFTPASAHYSLGNSYHCNLTCTIPQCHSNSKIQVPGAPPALPPSSVLSPSASPSERWFLRTARLPSVTGLGTKSTLCHSSNLQVYTDPAREARHCLLAK